MCQSKVLKKAGLDRYEYADRIKLITAPLDKTCLLEKVLLLAFTTVILFGRQFCHVRQAQSWRTSLILERRKFVNQIIHVVINPNIG